MLQRNTRDLSFSVAKSASTNFFLCELTESIIYIEMKCRAYLPSFETQAQTLSDVEEI